MPGSNKISNSSGTNSKRLREYHGRQDPTNSFDRNWRMSPGRYNNLERMREI